MWNSKTSFVWCHSFGTLGRPGVVVVYTQLIYSPYSTFVYIHAVPDFFSQ